MSINLAVFVSGRGSNLEAILNATREGKLSANIVAVVCNEPEAGALAIAKKYDVKTIVIPSVAVSRKIHESKVLEHLSGLSIDYLVLAGYMRILSPHILNQFSDARGFNRVINIHPSLLPAFPGRTAYEDAFNYGVKVSGVTVHFVDEKVDHGPILAQESFRRLPADSLADFKARGLQVEHELYPWALEQVAKNNIVIHARGEQ